MPLTPSGSHHRNGGADNESGRTKQHCGGKCVTSPDSRLALGTLLLMVIPSVIFDGWTAPWICIHWPVGWVFAVFALALEAAIFVLFFETALSDPGIIPRMESPISDPTSKLWHQHMSPVNPPKHQDITVHGHLFKMKYCISCNIYRPPRCVHCSVCDNCVDKFDHHCPWVGNCVGRRNYRCFFLFVAATSIFITIMLIICPIKFVQCLQNQPVDLRQAFARIWGEAWDAAVLTIYCFALLWFVLGLTGYHLYLISTNQTTYEQIKGFFDEKLNPWDRGCASNLLALLFTPKQKSFCRRNNSEELTYKELADVKVSSSSGRVESGGATRFCVDLLGGSCHSPSTRVKLFGGGSNKSLSSNKNLHQTSMRSAVSPDSNTAGRKVARGGGNNGVRGLKSRDYDNNFDNGREQGGMEEDPAAIYLENELDVRRSNRRFSGRPSAFSGQQGEKGDTPRSVGLHFTFDEENYHSQAKDSVMTDKKPDVIIQPIGVHLAAQSFSSVVRRHSDPTASRSTMSFIHESDLRDIDWRSKPSVVRNDLYSANSLVHRHYEGVCSSCFSTVSECHCQRRNSHSRSTIKIKRASLKPTLSSTNTHQRWQQRHNDDNPSFFSSFLKMMGFAGKCFSQTDMGKMTCVLPD